MRDIIGADDILNDILALSDEQLLNVDMCNELAVDPIDIQEMICDLSFYGFSVDSDAVNKFSFFRKPTVGNFILMCNTYGTSE